MKGMSDNVEGCPFCARIEAGEYDDRDEWSVTFEPLNPVTPGHRLFVPYRHIQHAGTAPHLTGIVCDSAVYWAYVKPDIGDFNLIINAGANASQTVPHLHVHLIPRRHNDGLVLPWTNQERSTSEDGTA